MSKIKLTVKTLAAAVLLAAGGAAYAQQGYLDDSSGQVVRSRSGECWHTRDYTSSDAIVGCDRTAPPPKPVPVAMPKPAPKPVAKIVHASFVAETFFGFDKASLRPSGDQKLDALVGKLKKADSVESITVTGHTDPIGTAAYNQKLSERRAETVSDYLAAHSGLGPKITAVGDGKKNPRVVCKGDRGKELIRCLQPDRRVDIDAKVTVTQ